jgi:hypothetical protein
VRGVPGRRPGEDRDARASATTARRWRSATRAPASPRCWT